MEDVTPSLLIRKVNRLLLEQADLRRQLKKVQAEIKPICERLKHAIEGRILCQTGTSYSPCIIQFRRECDTLVAELVPVVSPHDVHWPDEARP